MRSVRLTSALVKRPLDSAQSRLDALARLVGQLHPEKPLERGYAIVKNADGKALTTRAQATGEATLSLKFKDGAMDVAPLGEGAPPPSKAAASPARRTKSAKSSGPTAQEDLFG